MTPLPSLTSRQMANLDKKMIAHYGIDLSIMMENAGKALAMHARTLLRGHIAGKKILVLAGKGNNGGGGLVAARHLHNWGADVEVQLSSPPKQLKIVPKRQMEIARRMGIPVNNPESDTSVRAFQLIIDALLGYNQVGNPKGEIAELVKLANASEKPILALDVPTGLDPDTGQPNTPCIKAAQTLTLALPKKGLLTKTARSYVGRLFLADLSVPREYYRWLGRKHRSIFADDFIVKIRES